MGRNKKHGRDYRDESHYAKCIQQLKEWGAPVDGWKCIGITDVREDDPEAPLSSCELCGCGTVRYEHIMDHDLYFESVTVGCICAGIMEGDVLKARERERQMRNRASRRRNFLKHKWKQGRNMWYRTYREKDLFIRKMGDSYVVSAGKRTTGMYKGKPITDFYSAIYAAFDLADPVEEIL